MTLVTSGLILADLVMGNRTEQGNTEPENIGQATRTPATPPAVAKPTGAYPSAEPLQPEATPSAGTASTVPQRGSGSFTLAGGATPTRGSGGRLVRYQVKVENGSGQDASTFATAVDATLADPRGWTAAHQWSFQRVVGGSVDAVVLLATPSTTNRICRAGGLDPGGYTSCRTGNQVVINLARWLLAVPAFGGDIATYRQYVVNHEMGHQLGRGHVRCGASGLPAPVMQQQTLGLQGCKPNAWPFVNGHYLSGHPTVGQ